jgi:hypothetical protein
MRRVKSEERKVAEFLLRKKEYDLICSARSVCFQQKTNRHAGIGVPNGDCL